MKQWELDLLRKRLLKAESALVKVKDGACNVALLNIIEVLATIANDIKASDIKASDITTVVDRSDNSYVPLSNSDNNDSPF